MPDLRGVRLKGKRYWYVRRLSPKVAAAVGKSNLAFNLHTSNVAIAAQRAAIARAKADRIIEEAKRGPPGHFKIAESLVDSDADITTWLETLESQHGFEYAYQVGEVALGGKTPIESLVERRLAMGDLTQATAKELETTVGHFRSLTGAVFVEYVDRDIANAFVVEALGSGRWSRSTIRKFVIKLGALWNHSFKTTGQPAVNPWRGIQVKAPESERRAPTPEELQTLLEHAQEPLRAAIRILAMTGLRVGELRSSTLSEGFLEVPSGKTPNARRSVPIHECIEADVNYWMANKISPSQLTKLFRGLREDLELDPSVTLHGLRKYCYAALLEVEPRVHLVNRIIGHALPPLMKTYSGSVSRRALREVIDKLPPVPNGRVRQSLLGHDR